MATIRISIQKPHDPNPSERSFDMYISDHIGSYYGPEGRAGDSIDALVQYIKAFPGEYRY